jgi:arylsulfatase A-like enzyme
VERGGIPPPPIEMRRLGRHPRLSARRRRVGALCAASGALAVGLALQAPVGGADPVEAAARDSERPNVVVIMTDDQDVDSLRFMPAVQRVMVDRGTTFTNAISTTPLCCPSRASFLTGQYAHNHGVLKNHKPNGGFPALDGSRTLATWLDDSIYRTAHVGKYLNGYGYRDPYEIPPGWDAWFGGIDPSTYNMYDYTLNENGVLEEHGSEPEDYQTDVYARKAEGFIERREAGSGPFFLSVAVLAPHTEEGGVGPRPAPRHEGAFADEPFPRPPSFNEADVSDKPREIRDERRLSDAAIERMTDRYRDRLASLLAVDELVQRVTAALRSTGELDETVVVFTSDNGFLQGEHRLDGKSQPYQEAIEVPLVVRGPGVPVGATRGQLIGNIDLAPTVLDLTGERRPAMVDGRSFLPLLRDDSRGRDRPLLLESYMPAWKGVRDARYLYAERPTGERELYDLREDPYQLESVHADPGYAAIRDRLEAELRRLEDCAGDSCRPAGGG